MRSTKVSNLHSFKYSHPIESIYASKSTLSADAVKRALGARRRILIFTPTIFQPAMHMPFSLI